MKKLLLLIFILSTWMNIFSQNSISILKWVSGISVPLGMAHCGDDRLFVIEKAGKIRIIQNDKLLDTAFIDISAKVRSTGGEQGLLGLCFHPDYLSNGYFYVNYTDKSNATRTVIERYKVTRNPNKADTTSGEIILAITQPYTNHNGGCIQFGKDGYLYIGMGDGGSANDPQNNAQNKKVLLGKILRLDVDTMKAYKIPTSNPFINDSLYAKEIWALGVRNPWRYSFDKLTGDLWIGDVGQGDWEEIDYVPAGSRNGLNFGWRCYEGNKDFNTAGCDVKSAYTFPIHEYYSDQNTNGCSVTGGYVYRGDKYPGLYGKYIYGDYCSGKIWIIDRKDSSYTNTLAYDFTNNALTSFGEDAAGNLYFADVTSSSIYKIMDTCKFKVGLITTNPLCAGLGGSVKTDLRNVSNVKFLWSTGDTTAELQNLKAGTYSVRMESNQCLADVVFEIKDPITDTACLTPPFVTEICATDSAILIGCDQAGIKAYSWYKDGIELKQFKTKRIWVNEAGEYQLATLDSIGCWSRLSEPINIKVHQNPPKPSLFIKDRDTLIASPGYRSYRWFRFDQFIGSTIVNKWFAIDDGPYKVEVVDSNLCHSPLSDSVFHIVPATKRLTKEGNRFSIAPNPTTQLVRLIDHQHNNVNSVNWKILSIQLNEIANGKIDYLRKIEEINVENLASGIYILYLYSEKIEERILFVKSN